jgi:hypothetical protein
VSQKLLLTIGAGALLILGSAVGGYLLGQAAAPSAQEWQEERIASQTEVRKASFQKSFVVAKTEGREGGFHAGKRHGIELGRRRGAAAGDEAAEAELVAIEEAEAPDLEYVSELPNGDPGYVLPEDERSISCIGYSAVDGECVGD